MIRELFALYAVYCAHLTFYYMKTCNLVTELNVSTSKFWPVFKTTTGNKQNWPIPNRRFYFCAGITAIVPSALWNL